MGGATRFDKGAKLAWALDRHGGYRDSAQVEWRFVGLDEARLDAERGVDVAQLVDAGSPLPPVTLAPAGEGRVRIHGEAPLVVLTWGESDPTLESSEEEVPYGTVVRAGPLLLSPLYAEQHHSVKQGLITLVIPPAVLGEGRHRDSASDLPICGAARRRVGRAWTASWVLSFVMAAVASVLLAGFVDSGWYMVKPSFRIEWHIVPIFMITQAIFLTIVGLPIHLSMMQWQRTPGIWESKDDVGPRWPTPLAVTGGALAMLAIPWALGLALCALLEWSLCSDTPARPYDIVSGGLAFAVVLSIPTIIVGAYAAKGRYRLALKWLGPPARFIRDDRGRLKHIPGCER